MNGLRAECGTKACKMAFFRTAGGAAGASAREGAPGAGQPGSRARDKSPQPGGL